MKLIIVLLVTTMCWTISYARFFSETSPFYDIESKALKEKINPNDYRKFALDKEDDLKTTLYKLISQYKCFREAKKNWGNIAKQLIRDCQTAYQKFPNSPEVAVFYFKMHGISNTNTENFQFADMVELFSYINSSKDVPGIPLIITSLIKDRIYNLKNILPENKYIFKRYAAITGGRTFKEVKQRLELLADYWTLQINPEYSPKYTKEEIDKVKQRMTYAKKQEAIGIWRNIIKECSIGSIDSLRRKFRNELAAEQFKQKEKRLKQMKEYHKSIFSKRIKELEKELMTPTNDYRKIMNMLSIFQGNKKLLQDYKHVPGYENLLKHYQGSEEAQILDAAFFIYTLHDYKKALTILDQLKCKDTNIKVLFFRTYATLWSNPKSSQSISEALALVNKIIELDPKNKDAQILKIRLEEKQKKL